MMAKAAAARKPDAERVYTAAAPAPPPALTAAELRQWRKRRRLTQTAAATVLGLNLRSIQRYEKGELPVPATVAALALALDRIAALEAPRRRRKSPD